MTFKKSKFYINWRENGERTKKGVNGYISPKGWFGVHKTGTTWGLTHIPSGNSMPNSGQKTLKGTKAVALKAESLYDWSGLTLEELCQINDCKDIDLAMVFVLGFIGESE